MQLNFELFIVVLYRISVFWFVFLIHIFAVHANTNLLHLLMVCCVECSITSAVHCATGVGRHRQQPSCLTEPLSLRMTLDISLAFSCLMAAYFVYGIEYPNKKRNIYGTFCVWYFRKWQNTAHGAACCKYVVCSVLKQCLSTQHICSTALIPVWSGTHQVNFSKLLERHIFQARCSFCHKHHNDNNDDEKNNNININVVVLLVCIYY